MSGGKGGGSQPCLSGCPSNARRRLCQEGQTAVSVPCQSPARTSPGLGGGGSSVSLSGPPLSSAVALAPSLHLPPAAVSDGIPDTPVSRKGSCSRTGTPAPLPPGSQGEWNIPFKG